MDGSRQDESSPFHRALRSGDAVRDGALLGPHRAVRVCRLPRRDVRLHADGYHRQRRVSAQVRSARRHARRLQLRLLQQRREEIPQAQQGPLLRGKLLTGSF